MPSWRQLCGGMEASGLVDTASVAESPAAAEMQEAWPPVGESVPTVRSGARGGGILWLSLEVPGSPDQVQLVWRA